MTATAATGFNYPLLIVASDDPYPTYFRGFSQLPITLSAT